MATPAQLEALARQAEQKYGLPQGMLVAQLRQESSDGRNTANPEGPVGVMQMQPGTARGLGVDPNDPAQAIDGAGRLMAQNMKQAGGNASKALELYYGGPNTAAHGPRTKAYPGQVGNRWDDGDAFEAASTFAPQKDPDADSFEKVANFAPNKAASVPSGPQATPTPSQPASPFQQALTTDSAPYTTSGPDTERQEKLEKSLAQLRTQRNLTVDDLGHLYRSFGYDTSSPQFATQANAWLQSSPAHRGTTIPIPPNAVIAQPSVTNSITTGAKQGMDDVVGSMRELQNWADNKVPALNAIDSLAGKVIPALDPSRANQLVQSYQLNRDAYDSAYGNDALAGVGRAGGQIAGSVPLMVATDGMVNPLAARVGAAPVAEFLAGRGGGNLLTRIGSRAVAGARAGGEGAALTSASSDQPLGDQIKTGMEVGGVLGPAFGALGAGYNKLKNVVAPGVDAETARLAQLAKDKYGIDLGGGQVTNNPLIRRVDAQLETSPGTGVAARNAGQRDQFTRAVGRTFGADSPRLTPEVMSAARKNLGGQFDQIAARTPIHVDDGFLNDLAGIETDAKQVVTDQEAAPIINQLNNVLGKVGPDEAIPGETYQALTRKGSPLEVAERSPNPNIAHYAGRIRDALDDAMERSANPGDLAQLRNVRLQYKNMKTIDPLVAGSVDGSISPAALMQRVKTNFKDKAYSGADDLGELASIGQRFLKAPSSSGTAENEAARRMMGSVSGGLGLGTGIIMHHLGAPMGVDVASGAAVAGAGMANSAKNVLLAKMLNAPGYRNRLIGKALNDNNTLPRVNVMGGLPLALTVAGNELTRKSSTQQGQ